MKWIPETRTLELSERNVLALLAKLNDPKSARTLAAPCKQIQVTAVETPGAAEAVAAPGTLPLTRNQLGRLLNECVIIRVGTIEVIAVADSEHYSNRLAGQVHMPSSGETW